jgi:ribosomal protein L15E
MSDKKSTEKDIRKLTKIGKKSIGLTLPIELVRELGWREKQKVVVKRVRGGVLVKDWKK